MTDREARRIALSAIVATARASIAAAEPSWTVHPDSKGTLLPADRARVVKAASAVLDVLERRANRNRSFGWT